MEKWTTGLNKENAYEGSANGDVELFAGKEVSSTIRESIQNSSDVPASDEIPVRVEIEMYDIPTSSIPQFSLVSEIVQNIKDTPFWKNDDEVQKRVNLAQMALRKQSVTVLRLSDYNTVGATGAKDGHEVRTPFTALTRANYVSHKANKNAAGSRGIGKNSVKGISDLRMVLFTSQTDNDGKYSSGQMDIATFADKGKISNRINYLVGEDNEAVKGEVINDGYIRNENGTDVRIIAVNDKYADELRSYGLVYILDNFLTAIYEEKLVIKFLGQVIDKKSLEKVILSLPEDRKQEVDDIRGFYRALKFGKVYHLPEEFETCFGISPTDGNFYLKIEEKTGNKVLFTRQSGMKIYDKVFNAPDKFSGVFRATGKLNQVLRIMEDATHTSWKEKLFDNRNELINYKRLEHSFRKDEVYARNLLEKLTKFIKNTLNEAFGVDDKNEIEANEISNLFYLEEDNEDGDGKIETSHQHIANIKIGKKSKFNPEGTPIPKEEEFTVDEGNIHKSGKTNRKQPGNGGSSDGFSDSDETGRNDGTGNEGGEKFKAKNLNVPNDWAISNPDGSVDYIFEAPKNMTKFGIVFEAIGEGAITVNPILKAYYNDKEMQAVGKGEFYILERIKKGKKIVIHLKLMDDQPIGLRATLRELRRIK